MQYIAHLGLAALWRGVLGRRQTRSCDVPRSDDIATLVADDPEKRRRFITERTVIEDSDTTVDLLRRDWKVYNHSEPMAFSATPSDFGSLAIQRRRWANGGLIILPGLLRLGLRSPKRRSNTSCGLIYLVSTAVASTCVPLLVVILIVAFPFRRDVPNPWLAVAALPALALFAEDLRRLGYRRRDLASVYALNIALIPINIAGTLHSLRQALTRRPTRFGRTPKIVERVRVPSAVVLSEWFMLAVLAVGSLEHARAHRTIYAAFLGANALVVAWAIVRFVGVRESLSDLRWGLRSRHARAHTIMMPQPAVAPRKADRGP